MSIPSVTLDRLKVGDDVIYQGKDKALFNSPARVKGILEKEGGIDGDTYWVYIYNARGNWDRFVHRKYLAVPPPVEGKSELNLDSGAKESKELEFPLPGSYTQVAMPKSIEVQLCLFPT